MRTSSRTRTATPLAAAGAVAALLGAGLLAGCSPPEPPKPPPHRVPAAREDAPPVGAAPADPRQAGLIVTERYGGHVVRVEPDEDDGQPTWSVSVRGSDQGDIRGQVSQRTGTLLDLDRD